MANTHQFQTEVRQLLDIVIHAFYSDREVFVRELVSNASDALDKLKYLALTDDRFKNLDQEYRIDIRFDEEAKTLTIADTGLGMEEKDLALMVLEEVLDIFKMLLLQIK